MDVSVIIPTYNERENLAVLVPRLIDILRGRAHEIVVVDDDSPDESWRLVEEMGERFEQVRCYHRIGRRGLSSAVVDGCTIAKGHALVVMDADLQHDPAKVPALVELLESFEIAVGTRFSGGGSTGTFSQHRRLMSRVAATACRLVLGVPVSDPMSGFFAIRHATFDRIAGRLDPRGYKILMEMLWRSGARAVGEVGYVFGERTAGISKLDSSVVFDFLWSLITLRCGGLVPARFVKYALVGLSGVAVQLGLLRLLHGLAVERAVATSIAVAVLTNYLLNNYWTFRDVRKRTTDELLGGFLRFALICGTGAFINEAVTLRWKEAIPGGLYIASLIGIAFATAWNYTLNRQLTWKDDD